MPNELLLSPPVVFILVMLAALICAYVLSKLAIKPKKHARRADKGILLRRGHQDAHDTARLQPVFPVRVLFYDTARCGVNDSDGSDGDDADVYDSGGLYTRRDCRVIRFVSRDNLDMGLVKKIVTWARIKSPWIIHFNTGACNACDIEIIAALTPRYDVERFGVILKGTPRHADVLVCSGPVTRQIKDRLIRIYEQMPEPKFVVAVRDLRLFGRGIQRLL